MFHYAGANHTQAIGEQVYDLIEMEAADIDELLASDRMECIVDKTMMRRRNWEIGDTVVLKCYYISADSEFGKKEFVPMGGTIEVKIVGTMSDVRSKHGYRIELILPYAGVLRMYEQYGHSCFADSASFCKLFVRQQQAGGVRASASAGREEDAQFFPVFVRADDTGACGKLDWGFDDVVCDAFHAFDARGKWDTPFRVSDWRYSGLWTDEQRMSAQQQGGAHMKNSLKQMMRTVFFLVLMVFWHF